MHRSPSGLEDRDGATRYHSKEGEEGRMKEE